MPEKTIDESKGIVDWLFGYSATDSIAIVCLILSVFAFFIVIFKPTIPWLSNEKVDDRGRMVAGYFGIVLFIIFIIARFLPIILSLMTEQSLVLKVNNIELNNNYSILVVNSDNEIVRGKLEIEYGQLNILENLSREAKKEFPTTSENINIYEGKIFITALAEEKEINVESDISNVFLYHKIYGRINSLNITDSTNKVLLAINGFRQAELINLNDPDVRLYKPIIVYTDQEGNKVRASIGKGLNFEKYSYGVYTKYFKTYEFPTPTRVNILPNKEGGIMKSGKIYNPNITNISAKYFPIGTNLLIQTFSGTETKGTVTDCLSISASSEIAISPKIAKELNIAIIGRPTLQVQINEAPFGVEKDKDKKIVVTRCKIPT